MPILLAAVFIVAVLVPQNIKDYRKLVGTTVTVCGQVVTYQHIEKEPACTMRLDIGTPSWSPSFYVVLRDHVRSRLGGAPESDLLGQSICVTGLVQSDRKRVPYIVVSSPLQLKQTSTVPVPPFAAGVARTCEDGVTKPHPVREVKPEYESWEFVRRKLEDVLLLEAVVEADGSVGEIRTVYRRHPEFEPAAHKALKQWRFRPATRAGNPVPVLVTVEIAFTLR